MKPHNKNLISNKLEITEHSRENVISANDIIKLYPQLSVDELHDIQKLEILSQEENSVIYKFDTTILKFATNGDIEGFYREIIIGLEINSLKSDNFVRTIGYYHSKHGCDVPLESIKEKECVYLYVKEISGPTLTKFILTASISQFKHIMNTLLSAYEIAVKELDFCHYDLHSNNVIITSKENELIPVIIDFGASHIKLKLGDTIANIGEYYPEQGRYENKSLWVYDLFKIFAFCWQFSDYSNVMYNPYFSKTEKNSFRENYNNLLLINRYCLKILFYFVNFGNENYEEEWLRLYSRVSPSWGVAVTKDGENASLSEFIKYVRNIDN